LAVGVAAGSAGWSKRLAGRFRRRPRVWIATRTGSKRGVLLAGIERQRELRRRRHRRKKLKLFARKLEKATVSEKTAMAEKLRKLTPGAEDIIERWELEKRA